MLTPPDMACILHLAIPVSLERCLLAVYVCILLLSCDHLVIFCLVPFSTIHFYVGLFAFNCYVVGVLNILGVNSLSEICNANNFLTLAYLFPPLIVSFDGQKFLILM